MTEHARIEVHRGKRYRLVVHPTVETAAPVLRRMPSAKPRRRAADDVWAAPVWRFYDLGSQVTQVMRHGATDPGDLANRFAEIRLEGPPSSDPVGLDAVRQILLAAGNRPSPPQQYLYSGRTLFGSTVPLSATAEVSGYNCTLGLRRLPLTGQTEAQRIRWSRGLQHNAAWSSAMRTPDEQLESWDALEPDTSSPTHKAWQTERDRIEKMLYEKFDFDTLGRSQQDLVVRSVGTTPGLWSPSFVGGSSYASWDNDDPGTWTFTPSTWQLAPTSSVLLPVGVGQSSDIHCMLAPRRHRIVFKWTALFLNIIMFAPPILSIEINTSAMQDRLPFGYSTVFSPGTVVNDSAMSSWISRSNRYAVAIQQDAASQVISPYFVKLLVGRVGGTWTVHEGNEFAGDVAAVLYARRGERVDRFNVFRRVFKNNEDRLLDFGSLNTGEVTGLEPGADAPFGGYTWGPI